jgi:ABC-type transport system involved in cytochrome c biogenesis ATPase subunit
MSVLEAAGVWVTDGRRALLEPTSVAVATGEVVTVYGDPGHRHTLLSLALGGRLVPTGGELRIDAEHGPETRQQQVALVDVPGVSEPDDVIALTTVVGEELAMAGKPARRDHVDHWLTSNGLRPYRDDRVEDLPAGLRTVAMARLASLRPGVQFLVLAMPERSGIDPVAWLDEAAALAGVGFGVLATVSTGVARHLERDRPDIRTVPFGNAVFHDAHEPEPEPAATTSKDAR